MVYLSSLVALSQFVLPSSVWHAIQPPAASSPPSYPSAVVGLKGSTVSEQNVCSSIGGDMLLKGGSAVDAMISMVLCVGVTAAYHSGLGGGGYAIVRQEDPASTDPASFEVVDFWVSGPLTSNTTMFEGRFNATTTGPLSIAVPGQLVGLEYLHKKYGKLAWKELFEPNIKLANEGFPISLDLYRAMVGVTYPKSNQTHDFIPSSSSSSSPSAAPEMGPIAPGFLLRDPTFASIYAHKNGTLLGPGAISKNPLLGKTLERISTEGAKVMFGKGNTMGKELAESVRERGGIIRPADFESYSIRTSKEPLMIKYRNYTIYTPGAPASGSILLNALNILSGFPPLSPIGKTAGLVAHRTAEALKFAYARRGPVGDPRYFEGVEEHEAESVSFEHGIKLRAKISDSKTFPPEHYLPSPSIVSDFGIGHDDVGTSQFSAVDSDGLSISLTTTVVGFWGSGIICPRTGITFNDGMENFAVPGKNNMFGFRPSPANYIQPMKRPISSTCPYLIESPTGELFMAGGAAGGSRIMSASTQVIRNIIDGGMNPLEALKFPRLHDQLYPLETSLELSDELLKFKGFDDSMFSYLASLGHNVTGVPIGQSTPAVILRDGQSWDAVGEPRKFDAGGWTG